MLWRQAEQSIGLAPACGETRMLELGMCAYSADDEGKMKKVGLDRLVACQLLCT